MGLPFIYIASLRRTGSTVLSEALTQLPHSFIFREPRLGDGRFRLAAADEAWLERHRVGVRHMVARWRRKRRPNFIRAFRRDMVPALSELCEQVGVKEIRNERWMDFVRQFPDLRIMLTARDPRDIYLSLHDRIVAGRSTWDGELTPEALFDDLRPEFECQCAMNQSAPCMIVRYEDLCTDPRVFDRVKRFCRSTIPGMGQVGAFVGTNPNRITEQKLHGSQITTQRVSRWRGEESAELRSKAERFFELMSEYCQYFGYQREDIAPLPIECGVAKA